MSQAPHTIRGMRWGVGLGEGKLEDSLMVCLFDTQCGLYMAQTAELYAEQQGITREQDGRVRTRAPSISPERPKNLVAFQKRSRRFRCETKMRTHRRVVREGRSPSSRNYYRAVTETSPRFRQEWNRNGGQCQWNRRRSCGSGRDVR